MIILVVSCTVIQVYEQMMKISHVLEANDTQGCVIRHTNMYYVDHINCTQIYMWRLQGQFLLVFGLYMDMYCLINELNPSSLRVISSSQEVKKQREKTNLITSQTYNFWMLIFMKKN